MKNERAPSDRRTTSTVSRPTVRSTGLAAATMPGGLLCAVVAYLLLVPILWVTVGSIASAAGWLIMFFMLFFFLRDRVRMLAGVERFLPLTGAETHEVFKVSADMVQALFMAPKTSGWSRAFSAASCSGDSSFPSRYFGVP